jgi:hypothetical protein
LTTQLKEVAPRADGYSAIYKKKSLAAVTGNITLPINLSQFIVAFPNYYTIRRKAV